MPEDSHGQRSAQARGEQFATTRWTLVRLAGQRPSPDSRRALESLCETYWYPLYAYVRRRVSDTNQAQDLTQAFFAELLEKNYVGSATPERGKFRAYLLTAFKHFLSKQWDKARAQKRGAGRAAIPLDFKDADSRYRIQPCGGLTAEQLYDRQWALTLLHQIMQRLEDEFVQSGKAEQFQRLRGFLIGEHSGATFRDVAAKLNITEAAAKMAAHRMRRRYRQLLREEIAQTVDGPDDVDDEIRNLFATLEL